MTKDLEEASLSQLIELLITPIAKIDAHIVTLRSDSWLRPYQKETLDKLSRLVLEQVSAAVELSHRINGREEEDAWEAPEQEE